MAGATLEFRFQDEEVRAMARRFREQLARVRFKPLLTSIGNELITSVSRRFETGTAPDGSRWPESLRARLTGGQTLIKSGRLRDSIAETGPQLTARSVEVGTNVVYAAIHQFGGIIPPHIIRARRARALRIPGIGFRRHHPGPAVSGPFRYRRARHPGPHRGLAAQETGKNAPVARRRSCLTNTGPPSRPI